MDITVPSELPPPLRRHAGNSNDACQSTRGVRSYVRHLPPQDLYLTGDRSQELEDDDDFPTPRAFPKIASSSYSPRRATLESTHTDFEEYFTEEDLTDDSEVVPFKLSSSMRRHMKRGSKPTARPPSLVIPSPSLWPSVGKPSDMTAEAIMNSALRTPLSPQALARLNTAMLLPPIPSEAPSLTEGSSQTSEHAPANSCPPTPSLGSIAEDDSEWGKSVTSSPEINLQLSPVAMDTLLHLSAELPSAEFPKQDDEDANVGDMAQVRQKGLSIDLAAFVASYAEEEDILSPISIPSPGGFLSSLTGPAAEIWSLDQIAKPPDTGTAENFYSVPWDKDTSPKHILEPVPEVEEEDPITARRLTFDLDQLLGPEAGLIEQEADTVDEQYEQRLSECASQYSFRTMDWVASQERYMAMLRDTTEVKDPRPPTIRTMTATTTKTAMTSRHSRSKSEPSACSAISLTSPTSKKSVRFADELSSPVSASAADNSWKVPESDSVLYHAFQHLSAHAKPRDAYIHRNLRADTLRVQRHYRKAVHRSRLRGTFSLDDPLLKAQVKPAAASSAPSAERDVAEARKMDQRRTLAGNSKQRQALEQLDVNSWPLEAQRFLDGGSLLPQSASLYLEDRLATRQQVRVLDFGGQPTAGWGWAMAVEYRDAQIYTVPQAPQGLQTDWLAHRGPSNHRISTAPKHWSLPFPSGFFDIISARSMHQMLKMTRVAELQGLDEWEATLIEIHRVLAPGGIFHFSLLDAELIAPSNSGLAAKSIEFAVSLRTRGYDPCAGRHILQRFTQAGFGNVRQTWISLPWASAGLQNNDAMTGLVGSLAWEQWLLKLQVEMKKPDEALLDGVPEALDEAKRLAVEGRTTAWKMLMGCARKA